jgi:hypothetical protein
MSDHGYSLEMAYQRRFLPIYFGVFVIVVLWGVSMASDRHERNAAAIALGSIAIALGLWQVLRAYFRPQKTASFQQLLVDMLIFGNLVSLMLYAWTDLWLWQAIAVGVVVMIAAGFLPYKRLSNSTQETSDSNTAS